MTISHAVEGGRRRASLGEAWSRSPRLRAAAISLPVLLVMGFAFAWPLVDVFLRSLSPTGALSYTQPDASLTNYRELFGDQVLRQVLWNTAEIAAWTTLCVTLIALPTAYLLTRLSRKWAAVMLLILLLPYWVSILVRLFAFTEILADKGIVNQAAEAVGLGPVPLLFNTTGAVIGMINYLLPYMILVLYAGMAGIDQSLVTAAKTLGASSAQAFRRVYFPLLRPALVGGILLVFVLSLGFFLTPAILGGAGDVTVAVYIQQQIDTFQWGVASASGIVLLVVTIVGYGTALRLTSPKRMAGTSAIGKGASGREPLRFGITAIALWCALALSAVILILPLIVVVPMSFGVSHNIAFPPKGFTFHWYGELFRDPIWIAAIGKSALVAAATAALATVLALAAARAVHAIKSSLARSFAYAAALSPLVVPSILLAIGTFDVQARIGLLESSVGLILAHLVITFPLTFIVLSSAFANLDDSLEAAAWTLGASRSRAYWMVAVRAVLPSVGGAFVLAFMTSWDETVIALFQSGLDKTFPVTIYAYLVTGIQPVVPAAASLLIGLVVGGFALGATARAIRSRRRRLIARI